MIKIYFFFNFKKTKKFGGSEAIITAISDEYPLVKRNRETFVAILFSIYFLIGLASCTQVNFSGENFLKFLNEIFLKFKGRCIYRTFYGSFCSWLFNIVCRFIRSDCHFMDLR